LEQIAHKNNTAATHSKILQRAVDNVKPRLEVKARRVGGATYQVPLEVPGDRQLALALRWLVRLANKRKGIPTKQEALAAWRIMEALSGTGQCHPEARRSSQDGPVKQSLRAFSLVGSQSGFCQAPRRSDALRGVW
jgi:small subunit ribosomal protein S7